MARIKHTAGIEEMPGAHSKGGIVERRKIFRDYDGNLLSLRRSKRCWIITRPVFMPNSKALRTL